MASTRLAGLSPNFHYVFSDVDNTLTIYGTRTFFPGAVRFLHETRGDMDYPYARLLAPKVTILSARPNMGFLTAPPELMVDGENIHGDTMFGHPIRDCFAKDVWRVRTQEMSDRTICVALGKRKVQNLQDWKAKVGAAAEDYPAVFVGDNGEGDALAAATMLEMGMIKYAFIHRLEKDCAAVFIGHSPIEVAAPNIFYFDSYAEAADQAGAAGLLTPAAVARVRQAIDADLESSGDCFAIGGVSMAELSGALITTRTRITLGDSTPPQRWLNRMSGACDIIQRGKEHARRHSSNAMVSKRLVRQHHVNPVSPSPSR